MYSTVLGSLSVNDDDDDVDDDDGVFFFSLSLLSVAFKRAVVEQVHSDGRAIPIPLCQNYL